MRVLSLNKSYGNTSRDDWVHEHSAYPELPCFFLVFRWAGLVARMGEERGVYRVLLGKPEGRRPLGRPRRRWVDNIRMDLREV